MDNKTFQAIKDILLKNQDIAVIVPPNPSVDQMAAGLGFYLVVKQMGKNVIIACPTDPVVELSSLVGIDKVQKNITTQDSSGDLTVSFPYNEGEIEKVSYTLDNGSLNIVVKAGEKGISFDQSSVQFIRASKAPSLLVFIGVSKLSDVSSIYSSQPQAEPVIINIDNKADNEKFGTIFVVDTKWSSVSEQVADFVTLLEPQVELDLDTAQNLLTGIDYATNDFVNDNTSYLAFEVAGILMKKGAKRQRAQEIINISKGSTTISNVSKFFPQQINNQNIQVQQNQPIQPYSQKSWVPQQPASDQSNIQEQNVQPNPALTSSMPKQTPPDWLTPKVYKGSSIV